MLNNRQKEKKLRAAIYIRVSTDEQAKEGYSLAFQEEKLKSFVASQDYILDDRHIYRDEGFSGTFAVEKRPDLNRLFEDAKMRQFDVVLVYRLDRFFRKTRLLLEALDNLNSWDVGFRSITESFDTTNITGRFMTTLLGAVAEMERETIRERTQGGRRMAAKSGKWVWGKPAYGLKLDPKTKKLKIVPEEAKWVRKFFEWIVNERTSATTVLKRANMMRVPCYKNHKRRKKNMEGIWHKKSITRILSNPIYTGTDHFFRFKKGRKSLSMLINKELQYDQSQWIEFHTTPIISQDLFDRCQKQLIENREAASRNLKNVYLFNKLIWCGTCGIKMNAGNTPPKKDTQTAHKFYQGSRLPKWRMVFEGANRHNCGAIAESRFESIWDTIKNLLENPFYTISQLNQYTQKSYERGEVKEKLDEAEKRLIMFERKNQKIDNVFLENDSANEDLYKKQKIECKRDIVRARNDIALLRQRLLNKKEITSRSVYLRKLYEKIKDRVRNATYEERALIVHKLVSRISLYQKNDEAEVELNLPDFGATAISFSFDDFVAVRAVSGSEARFAYSAVPDITVSTTGLRDRRLAGVSEWQPSTY